MGKFSKKSCGSTKEKCILNENTSDCGLLPFCSVFFGLAQTCGLFIPVNGRNGKRGVRGRRGFQGRQGGLGFQGNQGFQGFGFQGAVGGQGFIGGQGIQGISGTQGIPGSTAIIPFSSGSPLSMTFVAAISTSLVGLDAFGTNASNVAISGGTINLTGAAGLVLDTAFNMPRAGTLTSLSATFSNTAAVTLVGAVTITAQLWRAAGNSNIFSPLAGAIVSLAPTVGPGLVLPGVIVTGTSTFSVPVAAGDRLILVFAATSTAAETATINGYASGGSAIA